VSEGDVFAGGAVVEARLPGAAIAAPGNLAGIFDSQEIAFAFMGVFCSLLWHEIKISAVAYIHHRTDRRFVGRRPDIRFFRKTG
jgi:hypothetical protein